MFHQHCSRGAKGAKKLCSGQLVTGQLRRQCTTRDHPQHGFVSCPWRIRGLAVTDLWREDAAIEASVPGSASPWDWGVVASLMSSTLCSGRASCWGRMKEGR